MISVPCEIAGCDGRVNGDTRCHEHGGRPVYEFRVSEWGETVYLRPDHRPVNQPSPEGLTP